MGKNIGVKIQKTARWVYIAGMICACLRLLLEWIASLRMLEDLHGTVMLRVWLKLFWPNLIEFGIAVFVSYMLHLIIVGYGCIIEDNHDKARAAKELNLILKRKRDDKFENYGDLSESDE